MRSAKVPVLAENLRRKFEEKKPKPYRPQKQTLALITTGDNSAVAARGSLVISGKWVRQWKERIDRRWIEKYQTLPEMVNHKTTSKNISDIEKNEVWRLRCQSSRINFKSSLRTNTHSKKKKD